MFGNWRKHFVVCGIKCRELKKMFYIMPESQRNVCNGMFEIQQKILKANENVLCNKVLEGQGKCLDQ